MIGEDAFLPEALVFPVQSFVLWAAAFFSCIQAQKRAPGGAKSFDGLLVMDLVHGVLAFFTLGTIGRSVRGHTRSGPAGPCEATRGRDRAQRRPRTLRPPRPG